MKAVHDLSIRQKLTRVAVLASGTALLSASLAFATYDLFAYRDSLVLRLSTDAQIVGANSVSALLFEDEEAARTTLAALRAERNVIEGAIYREDGRLFASYTRNGGAFAGAPLLGNEPGHAFANREAVVRHPIMFENVRIGTVAIRSDMREMAARGRRYAAIVAFVSLASFLVALLISSRYQEAISKPILQLADTARIVSTQKDYSLRAAAGGQDEVGFLIGTFNAMLAQIQQRDTELEEARGTLEGRVEERTLSLQHELLERRRTEEALTRSQTLLAEAQRLAHVGSWEWELEDGRVSWSDEMHRVYGLARGKIALSFENCLDFVHPEDRAQVATACDTTLRTGAPFALDHRIVRQDGTERTLHTRGNLQRDAAGLPLRLVGTGQDITDRKAAEEERAELIRAQATQAETEIARRRSAFLAELGARLAATLDYDEVAEAAARAAVPEAADWSVVYTVQPDRGSVQVRALAHMNPAHEPRLHALLEQHLPQPSQDRGVFSAIRTGRPDFHDGVPASASAGAAELQEMGYGQELVLPLLGRNGPFGAMTFVMGEARPLGPAEQGLAREVADRVAVALENARLYREAQDANRLKDEFLATLSHELRTPLNAIVGWARLLRSGELDAATAARAVETIDRNAHAQTRLIEDILDVSRIVAGKLRLTLTPRDLGPVVEAALDAVRPAAEARGIRLQAVLEPTGTTVAIDGDRLQQVVWNLLSNAIKFTPRGGRVQVRVAQVNSHVEIAVTDSGIGIKAPFLPHVFERFRQADSSSTRPHGGLGLGLAIVRHLVELHGGSVEVDSEGEGKGSTFTVLLPRTAVQAAAPAPDGGPAHRADPEERPRDAPRLSGLRVLVVDDDADSREIIASVVRGLGADAVAAASADEALSLLGHDQDFDVLLSDIEMPGMDGYELIRRIRGLPAGAGGEMPAAALTAYARPEDRVAALEAGFQVHVAKPVLPEELAAVLSSLAPRRPA